MARQILYKILLLVVAICGTADASSHDVAWTFGNVGSSSYRLDAFEPDDAGLGASIGDGDCEVKRKSEANQEVG